jgi:hypothetical protein
VATGGADDTDKVWRMSPDDAAATCVVTLAGNRGYVRSVAFDQTGRFVATGSSDTTAMHMHMNICLYELEGLKNN